MVGGVGGKFVFLVWLLVFGVDGGGFWWGDFVVGMYLCIG